MRKTKNQIVLCGRKCVECGKAFRGHPSQLYCPDCRNARDQIAADLAEMRGIHRPRRRCHDYGKLTDNYRCAACWAKIRGGAPRTEHQTDGDYTYA